MVRHLRYVLSLAALLAGTAGFQPACAASHHPRLADGSVSAQDYTEIQELNSKYARYLDSNERDGAAWAELFTPDGVLAGANGETTGAKLRAVPHDLFNGIGKGNFRHWVGNPVLTPTPEGMHSHEYVLVLIVGSPPTIRTTAQWDDLLVKTRAGWRIKRRTVIIDKAQ